MSKIGTRLANNWTRIGTRFLPFADAATPELPLGRLNSGKPAPISSGVLGETSSIS